MKCVLINFVVVVSFFRINFSLYSFCLFIVIILSYCCCQFFFQEKSYLPLSSSSSSPLSLYTKRNVYTHEWNLVTAINALSLGFTPISIFLYTYIYLFYTKCHTSFLALPFSVSLFVLSFPSILSIVITILTLLMLCYCLRCFWYEEKKC